MEPRSAKISRTLEPRICALAESSFCGKPRAQKSHCPFHEILSFASAFHSMPPRPAVRRERGNIGAGRSDNEGIHRRRRVFRFSKRRRFRRWDQRKAVCHPHAGARCRAELEEIRPCERPSHRVAGKWNPCRRSNRGIFHRGCKHHVSGATRWPGHAECGAGGKGGVVHQKHRPSPSL